MPLLLVWGCECGVTGARGDEYRGGKAALDGLPRRWHVGRARVAVLPSCVPVTEQRVKVVRQRLSAEAEPVRPGL